MQVQDSSVHTASIPQRMRWQRSQWADEVGRGNFAVLSYSSSTMLDHTDHKAKDTCCDVGHDLTIVKPMWCMSPNHLEYLEPKFRFHPSYHAQVRLVRRKFDFVGFSAWWDSNGFFHNFHPSFFLAELMRAEVKLCETIDVLYWFMLYHHVLSRITGINGRCQIHVSFSPDPVCNQMSSLWKFQATHEWYANHGLKNVAARGRICSMARRTSWALLLCCFSNKWLGVLMNVLLSWIPQGLEWLAIWSHCMQIRDSQRAKHVLVL